jgi:hypothetical protein
MPKVDGNIFPLDSPFPSAREEHLERPLLAALLEGKTFTGMEYSVLAYLATTIKIGRISRLKISSFTCRDLG